MPFDDPNKMGLYKKILKANYELESELWQTVSPQCKSFIQSLLVLESERYLFIQYSHLLGIIKIGYTSGKYPTCAPYTTVFYMILCQGDCRRDYKSS